MGRKYGSQQEHVPAIQAPEPSTSAEASYGNGMMAAGLAEGWLTTQGDGVAAPDPELEAFLSRTYALKNHMPSTGMGCFDTDYDPKAGVMNVVLKLAFTFTLPHDATPMEKAKAIWEGTDGWTDAEKEEWLAEFKRTIEAAWTTDHVIRCVRPGWDLQVKPRLHIEAVEENAHYAVTIHKSAGSGSDFRPGVHESHGMFGSSREGIFEEDHTNTGGFGESVIQEEIERVEAMTEQPITFEMGPAGPILPAAEQSRVERMAAETRSLPPGSPKLRVDVDAWGDVEQGTGELEAAKQVAAMMPEPHTWIANNWGDNAVGEVTFEPRTHAGEISYKSGFQYASHEVGHMLGLTDEYEEGNEATQQQIAAHDALIEASGADALRRSADTSSMMSQGGDVLTGHLVTMWEALGIMTAQTLDPKEWQL